MNFILKILVSSLAVILTSFLLPGVDIENNSMLTAILVAIVLAFLNAIVKPILIILTIPVTVFTLGLFLIVINAAIILLADNLIDGFHVRNFWWAILFSLILSIVTSIFESLAKSKKREHNR